MNHRRSAAAAPTSSHSLTSTDRLTAKFERWHRWLLISLIIWAALTRIYRLGLPEAYVFDEVYHAVTAKLMATNDQRAFEWWNPPPEPNTAVDWLHPPLAKYTQVIGIWLFGATQFGWRISAAVFGVLVVLATYRLGRELFTNKHWALLAAGLASLDGLLLTQSRIAMNDIHVTFFILLTLICYVRYRRQLGDQAILSRSALVKLLITGLAAGLAVASKWSGLFVIVLIIGWEGLDLIRLLIHHGWWLKQWRVIQLALPQRVITLAVSLVVLPSLLYLGSYGQMFLQGKSLWCSAQQVIPNICYLSVETAADGTSTYRYISHFHELHNQIWWYQTNLDATHGYQSRPWQWFLNLRPVWFFVAYGPGTQIANIYAQGNPVLFVIGPVAVIWLGLMVLLHSKPLFWHSIELSANLRTSPHTKISKQINRLLILARQWLPLSFLMSAYLIVWLPWILSPRIMFFYHYTPAVPLLCLITAWVIASWQTHFQTQLARTAVWLVPVSLTALAFILWYPNWIGLSVPGWWADAVYFGIVSWK